MTTIENKQIYSIKALEENTQYQKLIKDKDYITADFLSYIVKKNDNVSVYFNGEDFELIQKHYTDYSSFKYLNPESMDEEYSVPHMTTNVVSEIEFSIPNIPKNSLDIAEINDWVKAIVSNKYIETNGDYFENISIESLIEQYKEYIEENDHTNPNIDFDSFVTEDLIDKLSSKFDVYQDFSDYENSILNTEINVSISDVTEEEINEDLNIIPSLINKKFEMLFCDKEHEKWENSDNPEKLRQEIFDEIKDSNVDSNGLFNLLIQNGIKLEDLETFEKFNKIYENKKDFIDSMYEELANVNHYLSNMSYLSKMDYQQIITLNVIRQILNSENENLKELLSDDIKDLSIKIKNGYGGIFSPPSGAGSMLELKDYEVKVPMQNAYIDFASEHSFGYGVQEVYDFIGKVYESKVELGEFNLPLNYKENFVNGLNKKTDLEEEITKKTENKFKP